MTLSTGCDIIPLCSIRNRWTVYSIIWFDVNFASLLQTLKCLYQSSQCNSIQITSTTWKIKKRKMGNTSSVKKIHKRKKSTTKSKLVAEVFFDSTVVVYSHLSNRTVCEGISTASNSSLTLVSLSVSTFLSKSRAISSLSRVRSWLLRISSSLLDLDSWGSLVGGGRLVPSES